MDQNQDPNNSPQKQEKLVEDTLSEIKENYSAIQKKRIKPWQVWLIVGLLAGIAAGAALVSNKKGEFERGRAAGAGEDPAVSAVSISAKNSKELSAINDASKRAVKIERNIGEKQNKHLSTNEDVRELKSVLAERRKTLEKLLDVDPTSAYAALFPEKVIEEMPGAVRGEVEQRISLEGSLITIHRDDFQKKTGDYIYKLKQGGKEFAFYQVGSPTPYPSGTKVHVEGYQIGGKVVAFAANNTVSAVEDAPPPESIGAQKSLVVLVRFEDSPPTQPFTPEQARDLVFNGQAQKFFNETSYGKVSWTGDAVGWYTIPRVPNCPDNPQVNTAGFDPDGIFAYIKSQNIDLKNYGRLIILTHRPCADPSMSFVGKIEFLIDGVPHRMSVAWIGTLDYYSIPFSVYDGSQVFKFTLFDYLLGHELGHSLGALHANAWECGQGTILYGRACKHLEYGNRFDVMGAGGYALHFNGVYKELFGWATPLVINKSGTYTINNLELGGGTPFARIDNPELKRPVYYLERRRALGFDSGLSNTQFSALIPGNQDGLFVNWFRRSYANSPFVYSRLLDMSPNASINPLDGSGWDDWNDVVLKGQNMSAKGRGGKTQTYRDVGNGIVLGPIRSIDENGVTFDVTVSSPTCLRNNPALSWFQAWSRQNAGGGSISVWSIYAQKGETISFGAGFENFDTAPCPDSHFTPRLNIPQNWVGKLYSSETTLVSSDGGQGWFGGEISIPPDAVEGNYTATLKIINVENKKGSTDITIPIIIQSSPPKG